MTKQPEDWLDDVPGDDVEDEDDEIIWVSKSEIKRDAEELTCATPSNSPSESKKRVAAASCSLSVRCCATAMSIRFVRRWTS